MGSFVLVGPKFVAGEVIEMADIVLMSFAMLNGPFVAGLLMTYLVDGKAGLKTLFGKMKKQKILMFILGSLMGIVFLSIVFVGGKKK